MLSSITSVTSDPTPYSMVCSNRAMLCGLSILSLKRRGFSKNEIKKSAPVSAHLLQY